MRNAVSLAEALVVLMIVGVLLALAVPRLSAVQDAAATRAAAADLQAMFATARHLAVTGRTAVSVHLDAHMGDAELRAGARRILLHRLGAVYGISMSTTRDSSVYDARGLGYGAANLTIVLRRGRAADTVVASRLGRVRSAW